MTQAPFAFLHVPFALDFDAKTNATIRRLSLVETLVHAGNRTGEQIDGYPSLASHNNLNQLTSIAGGGPVRFKGYISETGSVTVAGTPATMASGTNFSSRASTVIGTNVVTVVATDVSTNRATNTYTVVVTNGVVSRSLAYDLVGNLVSNVTAFSTNTYAWDAANRLVKITQALTNTPLRVTEFGVGVGPEEVFLREWIAHFVNDNKGACI